VEAVREKHREQKHGCEVSFMPWTITKHGLVVLLLKLAYRSSVSILKMPLNIAIDSHLSLTPKPAISAPRMQALDTAYQRHRYSDRQ